MNDDKLRISCLSLSLPFYPIQSYPITTPYSFCFSTICSESSTPFSLLSRTKRTSREHSGQLKNVLCWWCCIVCTYDGCCFMLDVCWMIEWRVDSNSGPSHRIAWLRFGIDWIKWGYVWRLTDADDHDVAGICPVLLVPASIRSQWQTRWSSQTLQDSIGGRYKMLNWIFMEKITHNDIFDLEMEISLHNLIELDWSFNICTWQTEHPKAWIFDYCHPMLMWGCESYPSVAGKLEMMRPPHGG